MPDTHALLGPSGAKRWLACTPSARFEQLFPDSESAAAAEGTLAHLLCEIKIQLALGRLTKAAYESIFNTEIRNSEYYCGAMENHCEDFKVYVLFIYNKLRKNDPSATLYTEQSYSFGEYVPEGFGTSDITIFSNEVIVVIDFKYGKGVRVDVQDNEQTRLYALGAVEKYGEFYEAKHIEMHIYQPRIDNIESESISIVDLYEWATNYVKPRAVEAFAGRGTFIIGDHCRFCRGAGACKAQADAYAGLAEEMMFVAGNQLPAAQLSVLLDKVSAFKSWIDDLQESAKLRHQSGDQIPGYKMVEGIKRRFVKDKDGASKALAESGLSATQIIAPWELVSFEKLYKLKTKKEIDEILKPYLGETAAKPTMVHVSDKRPEIGTENAASDMFDDGFDDEAKGPAKLVENSSENRSERKK